MQHRQQRVADAIREAVASIVLNDLGDPNIGFVTVTRCSVTRDLKIASVYFSILGTDKQRKQGLEHLQRARNYIRRLLPQHVSLRYNPELRFALDEVLDHERRVGELLESLPESERQPDEEPTEPDSEPGTAGG